MSNEGSSRILSRLRDAGREVGPARPGADLHAQGRLHGGNAVTRANGDGVITRVETHWAVVHDDGQSRQLARLLLGTAPGSGTALRGDDSPQNID
jgi:hypothetical protein